MKLCRQRRGKKEMQKTAEQRKHWADTYRKDKCADVREKWIWEKAREILRKSQVK